MKQNGHVILWLTWQNYETMYQLLTCTYTFQMTHERTKKQNKGRASEMNLAAILMCIVFLFFVCHFPRILLNVHEVFMVWDMLACGDGKWIYFQHANKVIHPKY